MQNVNIKFYKKGFLFASTALIFVGLLENISAYAETDSILQHGIKKSYVSQNNVVSDTVKLETIYVSQEGANLGWIVGVNDAVIAIDASGTLLKVLSGGTDSKRSSTVEYYTDGAEQGKLKRINNTYFQYYNRGIDTGKIRSIGNLYFQYYNTSGVEKGRIQYIGNIYFQYFNAGIYGVRVRSIGDASFTYNNMVAIRSIDGNQSGVNIKTTSIEQWKATMGVASEPSTSPLQPIFH